MKATTKRKSSRKQKSKETALTVYAEKIEPQKIQSPASFKDGFQLLSVEQQDVALTEYKKRRDHFRKWLLAQLDEGNHYGFPPGCEPKKTNRKQWQAKPSLYKAGALFIAELLNVRANYESDMIAWEMMGKPGGVIVRKCRLVNPSDGAFLGEGTGSYAVGRKKMDDNAAMKMADKTAIVAAVINTFALSDLFTQDLETLKNGKKKEPKPDYIGEEQRKQIIAIAKDFGIENHHVSNFLKDLGFETTAHVTKDRFAEVLDKITAWATEYSATKKKRNEMETKRPSPVGKKVEFIDAAQRKQIISIGEQFNIENIHVKNFLNETLGFDTTANIPKDRFAEVVNKMTEWASNYSDIKNKRTEMKTKHPTPTGKQA
jgi:putative heme iron utilization protein